MAADGAREDFLAALGFEPDGFQLEAIAALERGASVLVAAPTGAGKTVVGEFACAAAIASGGKTFYTTPIKALSNQKHRDLTARHGVGNVGLLTGDRSIDGDAPIVVMTTEVLRNMIYAGSSTLDGLRYVVLDEVHYLADRERGAVWEEVIIQLPASVQLVSLSATVSNAEDFGRWLDGVRDGCEVIIEERRPVPLRHHYFVNERVHDTFRTGRGSSTPEQRARAAEALAGVPNPEVVLLERQARQSRVTGRGRRVRTGPRLRWPSRPRVVEELAKRSWLPAIVFVFSRQGCEDAVTELQRIGIRLTDEDEREAIAAIVDTLVSDLPAEDLAVLGFPRWRAALLDGIAAHHAGLVPVFKEAVEACFQRGLLKVVYATETLALGINMPARTVVIERLEKYDGESHVLLTAGQYTQLTGRAGRRGIDSIGHAVVLYQRDLDFQTVAGLVGTRSYPLVSSFAPSYNMVVNLLRRHDLAAAESLVEASFAQYEADAGVSRQVGRLRELESGIEGYRPHLGCDRGDWAGYWDLRRRLTAAERRAESDRRRTDERARTERVAALRPGDVVGLRRGGEDLRAVVVSVGIARSGTPFAQLVTDGRDLVRLGPRDLDGGLPTLGRLRLPDSGNARQHAYRRELAAALAALEVTGATEPGTSATPSGAPEGASAATARAGESDREAIDRLRERLRAHACHDCPERGEHEVWQRRHDDLAAEADRLRSGIDRETGSLVRDLHRLLDVLTALGYLEPDRPVPTRLGLVLAGIHSEVDLLVAESIRRGLLDGLDPAELAGIAAFLLHVPRRSEASPRDEIPTARLLAAVDRVREVAEELRAKERAAGLRPLRELDAGFVAPAWRWATGADLDDALGGLEVTGGDFVRDVKQAIDLLGQMAGVADADLRLAAQGAVGALRRGIVEA
jgi:ATP-dependent RNA helicase HelY